MAPKELTSNDKKPNKKPNKKQKINTLIRIVFIFFIVPLICETIVYKIHSPTYHIWLASLAKTTRQNHSPKPLAKTTRQNPKYPTHSSQHTQNPRRGVWGNLGSPTGKLNFLSTNNDHQI